jgi:hypothetical protein
MSKPSIKPSEAGRDSGLHVQLGGRATSVIDAETQGSSGGLGWRKRTAEVMDPRGWKDFARSGEATISRSGPAVVPKKYPEYQWGVDGNPFDWIKQASAQIREARSQERINRRPVVVKIKEHE